MKRPGIERHGVARVKQVGDDRGGNPTLGCWLWSLGAVGYLPVMNSRAKEADRVSGPHPGIVVNTRVLLNPLTGLHRYTRELVTRLEDLVRPVHPPFRMTSALNQSWEQLVLPLRTGRHPLWSPANTGPLAVPNQVLTLHDMAALDHPEWFQGRFARYASWLTPRLARRVRHIITVSEFSRGRITALTGVPESKITVIPSAVPVGFEPRPEEEVRMVCGRFGLLPRDYVFYLGSIEPRKNLGRLVEAWTSCRRRLPDSLVLAVAGDRPNPQAFREARIPEGVGGLRWLGRVEDSVLPALLSGSRVFAYVSLYEGFGAPPLEALAAGAPVLASSVASIPEVLGDAALYVDPLDVGSIAAGLERLVNDTELQNRFRDAGPVRARSFTFDDVAARTRKVLLAHAG